MRTLSRLLAIRTPYAAKGAVLGASANRLHRRPHVLLRRQKIPTRRQELASGNPSAFINSVRLAREAIVAHRGPKDVAIAFHHGVSVAEFQGLFRKQGGVN